MTGVGEYQQFVPGEPYPLPYHFPPAQSSWVTVPPKVFAVELVCDEVKIRLEAPSIDELFELERRYKDKQSGHPVRT